MTDLPQSWELCTVADITAPVQVLPSNGTSDREIAYVDISSIDNVANRIGTPKRLRLSEAPSRARQVVQTGDVLFSTVRPYLRNIAAVPNALDGEIASTGFAVLRAVDGVDPAYLFYKATSRDFVAALTGEQYGVSYPAVKDEQVRAQPFELPPAREQHRIVTKIEELFSELDKAVESLTLARAQLKTYRQALLKAAFEGKLTADWRAANRTDSLSEVLPAANPAQDDELFEVPSSWRHVPLDALTEPDRPITYGVIKLGADVPDGVPTLRSSDVRSLRLDLKGVKRIAPEIAREYGRTFLKGGEVLITVRGTLGGVAVVPPELSDWNISREVAMIAPTKDVTAKYLQYALASPQLSAWFKRRLRGVAYTGINIGTLKEAPIYLCPLGEQHRIVEEVEARLSSLEASDGEIKTGILRVAILRQSILKKAFSGQLVPQDPTDEPAAAVLARLREQAPAPRTRRRKTA